MTKDTDRIRIGVFGVGTLGEHHTRIYAGMPEADLVGIHDIDQARSADMADKYGTTAFESLPELAGRIDAASVAVPTDKHFEVFSALADHGLHVLMEKPIASSTEQAESMVETAQDKGLVLQVGHVERFNPVMKFLEENLSTPRFIEAIRLAPFPPLRETGIPRGTEVSVVLDLMIHDLDVILHLVRSPIKAVHAVGVPVLTPSEDIANVRLSFESGCVANVTASRISQERMRKIRVFQEDTYVSLDYMSQTGRLRRIGIGGIESLDVPIEKGDALTAELTSFVQCVRHSQDPVVSGRQGSEVLNLAVDICRHIRENPS
jgi:predicted dehydrogenase